MSAEAFTYANIQSVSQNLSEPLTDGIAQARRALGADHPLRIGDATVEATEWDTELAPADRELVIGRFAQADSAAVTRATELAAQAYPEWARTPLSERSAALRRAADAIEARRFELAGVLVHEAGKSRLEALAEVDEAPVLIRIYCRQMEEADEFRVKMESGSGDETNLSVLRPYGPWAVLSPFNFPLALAVGPSSAALVSGQPALIKPSPHGQLTATLLREIYLDAGIPQAAVTVLPGNAEVGAQLVNSPRIGGVTFTGSFQVGRTIIQQLAGTSRPVICEMGGKNPAYVGATADVDQAAEGIARAAFGYSGQKCSACSRAFVQVDRYEELRALLLEKTSSLTVGDPGVEDVFAGPLINPAALARYERITADIRSSEGQILIGGERLTGDGYDRGLYVAPTVVELPSASPLWQTELFVPLVALAAVDGLDQAITRANDTEYGLTAGIYSTDDDEIARYFDEVEASVVYANRRSGATTGAWPGMQPISGWKASGSTGKGTGGPYYLQQYMREQTRSRVSI